MPADLDQTFSSVRQALAELMHSIAQLGVVPSSFNLTPKQTLEEFYKRDPGGDIDRIYAEVIKNAPGLKQAEAKSKRRSAISTRRSSICATARSSPRSTASSPVAT